MPNGYNHTNGGEGGIHKPRIISLNREVSDMEKSGIGKMLRERRNELSLTQRQVANYVGVTEATVSRWESGDIDNMRRDKIASLAAVLRMSPLLIMGDDSVLYVQVPPTSEELNLIDDYRTLAPEDEKFIFGMIKRLLPASSANVEQDTFNNDGDIKNNFVASSGRNSVNQNVSMNK